MQVEWFRSFIEAAKWRSMSKAGEMLNLTQPAVSKHIRSLEAIYGVDLLRRGSSGVELTEAGTLFLSRITGIVEALTALETEIRPLADTPRYILGSLPSVASELLPNRLRGYFAAGHTVNVSVRPDSMQLVEGLLQGSFDAVLVDREYAARHLWQSELFTEFYMAVLPKGHVLGGRRKLKAIDLIKESFVFPTHCDTLPRFTAIARSKYDYHPQVKLETDSSDYLLGLVAVETGIAILPEIYRAKAERLGLHAISVEEEELKRTIVLAARSSEIGSKVFRMLKGGELLKEQA